MVCGMMVWDILRQEKPRKERIVRSIRKKNGGCGMRRPVFRMSFFPGSFLVFRFLFFAVFAYAFFSCPAHPGGSGFGVLRVFAAEGTVSFGPESYAWNVGEVHTLEFSFHGDTAVDRYAVCLEYDPAILEYLDGADRVDGRQIWLEGGGGEDSYERVLMFRPRKSGNTQVKIVSASAAGGQMPDGTAVGEELRVDGLEQVSIAVQERGSRLSRLEIGFATGMEEFSPDVLEYHMQVAYGVDWLPMEYEMEDEEAVVTVSGGNLKEGSNVVRLAVQKGNGDAVVYTLYVEREAAPAGADKDETGGTDGAADGSRTGSGTDGAAGGSQADSGTDGSRTDNGNAGNAGAANGGGTPDGSAVGDPAAGDGSGVLAGSTGGAENVEGYGTPGGFFSGRKGKLALTAVFGGGTVIGIFIFRYWRRRKKAVGHKGQGNEPMKVINLDQTVIDVRHVTMNFRLAQDESSSLKEYLIKTLKGQNHYRVLSALKDVTFEVKQGEVLGIIGTNGSGKSTLLKIIAGALTPSKGKVTVDKSKVHMLTLGTGFDMELTARENVYLNGAIIGYTKEYLDEKFEDIVAFAELDGFMDERMKNFSSGMVSRLGFAIATMRDSPDILILDEVLSVGDMFFRKKSEQRIQEMIHSGATVLIVSHSSDFIRKNCDTVVWIEKGVMRMIGKPEEVCRAYGQMEK